MKNNSHPSTLTSYITGFTLSIVLTMTAYLLVTFHLSSGHRVPPDQIVIFLLSGLAIVQLIVQLFFFLHLGQESKPRWNLIFFLSTVSMILVIVVGSLWIMDNLNYHMTPKDMNSYILKDEGIKK